MSSIQNIDGGQVLPGEYGFIDYGGPGSATQPDRRALLIGYTGDVNDASQWTPNLPQLPGSQQEADDGAGRGSDLANQYASAISQPEAAGAEVWLLPILPPSAGVKSTYKLKVFVAATNPAKSGTIEGWLCSQTVPAVGFTTSDTSSTIATSLAASIASMADLPVSSAVAAVDVITITYRHKGAIGEDFPQRWRITPTSGSGVQLSPGQLVFTGSATGSGSVVVATGAVSVSTAIAGSDTQTAIATKVAASFNADNYPFTAAVDGTSAFQTNLFIVNNRDFNRISAAIVTSTIVTVNLGSGATDGSGSPTSLTYNGAQGTAVASLTSALTNLLERGEFRSWEMPFTDSTTLGAVATQIENEQDGSIGGQKQQHLTLASAAPQSVAGAIATAPSPNLTTTPPHYAVGWVPYAAVPAHWMAARVAAARAAIWLDTPQKNWNGFQLKGNVRAPLLAPWKRPSKPSQNTALRTYALSPWIQGRSGFIEVVKGRTTSFAQDKRQWAWSFEAQAAFHHHDLGPYLNGLFAGGSLVVLSEPKAPGIFDAESFKTATQRRMRKWELEGSYDGADALADRVKAYPSTSNPFAIRIEYPESPVVDYDQALFTGHATSQSQ